MRRISSKPVVCYLPLFFLLYPSCRVVPRGVPGANYAIIRVDNGQSFGVETRSITAYQNPHPKPPVVRPSPPIDKTHPIIDQWIKNPAIPDATVEDVLIGLLPPKDLGSQTYLSSFEEELRKLGGPQYILRYDSIYTFGVKLPVGALRGPLRADARIRYIEPRRVPLGLDMFPAQGASGSKCKGFDGYPTPAFFVEKIQALAARAGLDSFATPTGASIAILDSGVGSHPLLPEPQIARHDCLNPPCITGGPDGCANHGTPDAGILIATGAGSQPQGVLQGAMLHSFKVSDQSGGVGSCSAAGDAAAAVEALNSGVAAASPAVDVILTEMLIPGEANSNVSVAVDHAYDAGYPVIVAANPTDTLWAPANAHKGFPVSSTTQGSSFAADGRSVPAVWADTGSETLSRLSSNLCKHDGASGAAPYAAAVAVKLRHLLRSNMQDAAPGNIYALILALSKPDIIFSRLLYLPPTGRFYTGSFHIKHGDEAYAPVTVTSGQQLRAAIWWPESAANDAGSETHNEISLEIGKPDGLSIGKAADKNSVFQYLAADLVFPGGNWTIKVTGTNVGPGGQHVFWAAFTGP